LFSNTSAKLNKNRNGRYSVELKLLAKFLCILVRSKCMCQVGRLNRIGMIFVIIVSFFLCCTFVLIMGYKIPPSNYFRCYFVTTVGVNKNASVTFPKYDKSVFHYSHVMNS